MSTTKIRFSERVHSDFFAVLRQRVDAYFSGKKISAHANAAMVFKIIFFLSGMIGFYFVLLLLPLPLPVFYLTWILLGLFTAFVGVNVCHDALHGAISGNRKINNLLGYLLNMAGANAYLWKITHNRIHHTYTNIDGWDEDINISPLIRVSPHQKLRAIHRYQHWYTPLLYCLTSLTWVFYKDYKRFFQKKTGSYENKRPAFREYLILFFFKAFYYTAFIVLPILLIDVAWWHVVLGFVAMHLVEGFALAIIIQMAHMMPGLTFPVPNSSNQIEESWAAHQMHTTADYARRNPIVRFFFGGLNFHIEHHLFQGVCHVHHRALSPIVSETAREYGLPYHDIRTLGGAMRSHLSFLKRMGRNEYPAMSV